MSDTAKWYVVHTYSGYENKVATSIENAVENRKLHDLIQEVRVPTETVPVPLTDEEVARLGVDTGKVEVNFAVGDSVSVVSGYLDGFIGTVEALDPEKNYVRVVVSMMGKDVPVELELGQVRALD